MVSVVDPTNSVVEDRSGVSSVEEVLPVGKVVTAPSSSDVADVIALESEDSVLEDSCSDVLSVLENSVLEYSPSDVDPVLEERSLVVASV